MEKKEKKKGNIFLIIGIILLVVVLGLLIVLYVIPKFQEGGIEGIFHPTSLSTEQEKNYNLYLPVLEKYENLKNDDNYSYQFQVYYFEEVDAPVIALKHENRNYTTRMANDKITLFYIKNDEVITKEYDAVADIKLLYNTEKDEINYYLYQVNNDYKNYTITLLKDIVMESSNPYVVKLTTSDYYSTAYRRGGSKVSIPKVFAAFGEDLSTYTNYNKHDYYFSFVDGISKFRGYFKKALATKFYLKDIVTDHTREVALDRLSEYTIKPGEKILGKTATATSKPVATAKPTTTTKPSATTQQKSKCNSGYVYVKDDNRCYSNTDKKNQINRCGSGEVDLGTDCGKQANNSLCSSNPDRYEKMNGKCIDKYTLHSKSMECPSGYEILFGSYSGKTFNGECYRYTKPNY